MKTRVFNVATVIGLMTTMISCAEKTPAEVKTEVVQELDQDQKDWKLEMKEFKEELKLKIEENKLKIAELKDKSADKKAEAKLEYKRQ